MCFPFYRGWTNDTYGKVVHVDDIFALGQKERCDRLCVDSKKTIPVKNLGELEWYGGCHYSSDRGRGTLTIPQQSFAEELVKKFRVTFIQSVPLRAGVDLEGLTRVRRLRNDRFVTFLVV